MCSGTSSLGSATTPSGNSGKSRTSGTSRSLGPRAAAVRRPVRPTMADTAIVWFRRDLRVHDHPPLRAALEAHERVVPVFVLDARLTEGRFPSANRAHFLFESLRELRAALEARGGTLVLRTGAPERVLPELAGETGASAVYFASDVSPFALGRARRGEQALREAAVAPRRTPGNFVANFGELKPYAVFTPFWRAWRQLPRRPVHGAPPAVPAPG